MRVTIRRWGNSLALRIPKAVALGVGAQEGTELDLTVAEGNLIASPVRKKHDVRGMIQRITAKNRHPETEWGPPQGKEVW